MWFRGLYPHEAFILYGIMDKEDHVCSLEKVLYG